MAAEPRRELLKHNSTTPIVLSTTHATVYIRGQGCQKNESLLESFYHDKVISAHLVLANLGHGIKVNEHPFSELT